MKQVYKYKGYPIFLSDKPNKKYYAIVGRRKVYFGQRPYEQYKDRIGYYSDLDHGDPVRRKNFKSRFERIRHNIGSAAWFSDKLLW